MRLGRFKHHRRLFQAFDDLGLTYNEIQDFCCWEGTKWARERYEKDEGIKVVDTTGDEIGPYVDRRAMRAEVALAQQQQQQERRRQSITRQTDISVIVEEADGALSSHPVAEEGEGEDEEMSDEADSEGEEDEREQDTTTVQAAAAAAAASSETAAAEEHVAELVRRREQAITQRLISAWEQGASLPPELEQILKEHSERGTLRTGLDLQTLHNISRTAHGYALVGPAEASTARAASVGGRAAA